jgi:phospholipid/cholesterol/gamma-HCH transport system substrate-binding protein
VKHGFKAVAAILLVAAATAAVVRLAGDRTYVVRAEVANASGLRPGFNVVVSGVKVGKVRDVTLSKHDTAIATLELEDSAAPVGRDAEASVRPSNLLGEKVVALAPGDARHPARSGALIPLAQTSTPTELDDVLNALDDDTRKALAVFLAEQGQALVGRGGDLAAMLARMPRALDDARRLVAELGSNSRALGDLVERTDRIVASVARQRGPLARLVDSAGGAFTTLAARQTQLGETVRAAPGAVAQLHRSLLALQAAARPLIPAAQGLRAAAAPLTSTLRQLPAFSEAARPALQTVRAVAPSLQRLANQGTPIVRRLGPAAVELSRFARAAEPASKTVDTGIADTLGFMEAWARAIQDRDGVGHVYRIALTLSPDLISALQQGYILSGEPRRGRARRTPATLPTLESKPPSSAARPPKLQLPGPRLPQLELPRLAAPAQSDAQRPVRKLLDYLLK